MIAAQPDWQASAEQALRAVAAAGDDPAAVDAAYQWAVALAGEPMRADLTIDHAARLLALGAFGLALRRCDEYLGNEHLAEDGRTDEPAAGDHALRLVRAEGRSATGDHERATADTTAVRAALAAGRWAPGGDEQGRLLRVEGLAAADGGDYGRATLLLAEAAQLFLAHGATTAAAAVQQDRLMVGVRSGDPDAVAQVLAGPAPRTVSEHLLHAMALKRELRYERAQGVLRVLLRQDLDPAVRNLVCDELAVLLRLTRQDEQADELLQQQPGAAEPAALTEAGVPVALTCRRYDQTVERARLLITEGRLDQAESLLAQLRPLATTRGAPAQRDGAMWHLAAGELELAGHERHGQVESLHSAAYHLGAAADLFTALPMTEARAHALRLRGRAFDRLGRQGAAVTCWAQAHQAEEFVARRQDSDAVRVRMLQAVPDEHDERLRAAERLLRPEDQQAAAAMVVAMEAARGPTILNRILPGDPELARQLPAPGDLGGAWRWLDELTKDLPRSRAIWMMHTTPDRVYHAVLGRGRLWQVSLALGLNQLTTAIDLLMGYCTPQLLHRSMGNGNFDHQLRTIADLLGLDAVLPQLPRHIRRVAVVGGRELAEVPFAALIVPRTGQRVGHRFALSDLPCLSALRPLRARASGCRGDRRLLVQPPDTDLPAVDTGRGQVTLLRDEQATPAELGAQLRTEHHQLVRITCHGRHAENDPLAGSWLQLAAAGRQDGRLSPKQLQKLDLRGCATVVLGACESGMAQRRGRDEPVGFVRSAVHAGAAAVVAARWIAHAEVAATVLQRFERYLRRLPRDLALQRAQLDVCRGAPGVPTHLQFFDHPANWACWTLYGDPGRQTAAGPVRRTARALAQLRRPGGAPR